MHDNELLQAVSDMLTKQLQPVHTKLSGIDDRLLIIETDVSSLKEDVAVLKADVSGLKSDMDIVKSDVTGINVVLENDIQRNFSLLAESIGGINDKLDRTSTTADSNTDDIDVLKSAIRILAK